MVPVLVPEVCDGVPKMLDLLHPGLHDATEHNAGLLPCLNEEGHEFGLSHQDQRLLIQSLCQGNP